MNLDIIAFGIAKDIFGTNKIVIKIEEGISIAELKEHLLEVYPDFKRLASFRIAVNAEYQNDDFIISNNDEVVIIPPVAGG